MNLQRCEIEEIGDPQSSASRCCGDGAANLTTSICKYWPGPIKMRSVSLESGTTSPALAGGGRELGVMLKALKLNFNSRRRRQDMRCKSLMSEASGSALHPTLRVKASSTMPIADDNSGDKHSGTTSRNVSCRRDGVEPERNLAGRTVHDHARKWDESRDFLGREKGDSTP